MMDIIAFVERIAGLETDADLDGDMSGDDAASTLSGLIEEARRLSALPGSSYPAAWRWRVGPDTPWVVTDRRPGAPGPLVESLVVEPLYAFGPASDVVNIGRNIVFSPECDEANAVIYPDEPDGHYWTLIGQGGDGRQNEIVVEMVRRLNAHTSAKPDVAIR